MNLFLFAPYVIGLSPRLVSCLQVKPNEAVCFAVTRDANGNPKEMWIGKETIFSSTQAMSYPLKKNHSHGYDGFSAKLLVYEMNLNPGTYTVDSEPRYCRYTGIDWYRVHFKKGRQRNWRAIHSCSLKKNKRINLENDGETNTFV